MKTSNNDIVQILKPSALATILFCDVRGYAQFASNVSAAQLIGRLNSYFSVVTETLKENRGTVAKFIGDAVFAYWLAEEQPDHAALACQFASSLSSRLSAASVEMTTSIGIHTGEIVLVNFTLGNSRAPEPMGDSVNLASRLEALCTQYKAKAVASEAVMTNAGNIQGWTRLDSIMIKGKEAPIIVYGIL